jgi:hypothetical protein
LSLSVSDARVFGVTIRIINHNLTEQLLNCSSVEFQDFSQQLLLEVKKMWTGDVLSVL